MKEHTKPIGNVGMKRGLLWAQPKSFATSPMSIAQNQLTVASEMVAYIHIRYMYTYIYIHIICI